MKRRLKTFLTSFLAALFMATLIVPLAACTDDDNSSNSGNTVVSVVSMGNKGLAGVTVRALNAGNAIAGTTDENGKASLPLDKSLSYQVEFTDLPKGYYADPDTNYSIKANSTGDAKFYIPSKVIEGERVDSKYVYKTGDVAYDFSFTTTVGNKTISLSEELKNKKAVIINFWGTKCSNCQLEFPALESTYQMFEEDLSILALDPPQAYGDTDAKIVTTLGQWKLNLSFYYGLDSANVFKNFYGPAQSGDFALPISAIIDRYGVICELIEGGEFKEKVWQDLVAKYVADDYVPEPPDGDGIDGPNFIPDLPADFGAKMSDPDAIDRAINKTGTDILFYADPGEYSWPWALSSDGKSIVPLGSGHGRSYSIIYASIDFPANKALLVDYRVSSQEEYDLFEIVSDYNDLGRVTFTDSGDKDWQTAVAYIPLKAGRHELAFVYYKGTQKGENEDTVYLNNLRFVDVTDEKVPSSDIPYYAARDYNARRRTYDTYETVYLDEKDGYYHVSGYESLGNDPYLLLDTTHIIPFTRSSSFYEQYISENNYTFGGKNYYNELMTYSYVAGNSAIEGAVPVTKELHDILVAICKDEAGEDGFEQNPDIWLEFCVFYLHYGSGDAIDNPVKGLAYFSAYEAKLTDVYDTATAMEQINAIYDAQQKKAEELKKDEHADTSKWDKIIADNTKLYEDNLATYNSVDFDNIIVPRGKMVKFTAPSAGVYHFYSVGREDNAEYICEAQLYDSSLKIHTALPAARPVATHDSDTLFRTGSPQQFHLYHYLKEGESCYLNLMFYSTETLDTMYYAINKIADTEYKVLKTVTAGFYTTSLDPETMGQLYRPIFPKGIEFHDDGFYYETSFNHRILVDFTGATRGLTVHTLENIIEAERNGKPIQAATRIDVETGAILETIDVTFNFEGFSAKIGNETIVGKDYTDIMRDYLDKSKLVGESSTDYGLREANKELRDILLLFLAKYDEIWLENDWLVFCYYYEYFGANY